MRRCVEAEQFRCRPLRRELGVYLLAVSTTDCREFFTLFAPPGTSAFAGPLFLSTNQF